MKKIYLSIFMASLGSQLSFAQLAPKPMTANNLVKFAPKTTVENTNKALGVTFWHDKFDNPAAWTVDNSGQSGPKFGWTIDATKDGWWAPATAIASSSEGNFAELTNGDPTLNPGTQALDVTYTLTTALPIDLTTNGTNVSLSFEQFGARFNDMQEIQISTDGTTFIPVGNNNDIPALSQSGGSAYPNPSVKTINLASYLSGKTQVWIRFSWTTNLPTLATNPNVWVAYGWYIDDVKLTTNADYDLAVTENIWGTAGLNYYQIPLAQVAPIDFSAELFNGGTQTMSNVQLNVNINSGAFVGSSAGRTINSLASDSIGITTPFTPSAVGAYTVNRTITATQVDDIPNNNTIAPLTFNVTNYIYARDNNTPSGSTTNGPDGFEAGNFFDIWQDATLKAINVRLLGGNGGTAVGTEIYAKLYEVDPSTGEFVYVAESDPLVVAATNLNKELVMLLQNPVNVSANKTYLAVVGSFTSGLAISNAGNAAVQTSFLYDAPTDTWFYITNTPYVRLNFDPVLGIEENNQAVAMSNVYPNPTNGITAVNYTLENAVEVTVSVVDITGKTILTLNQGVQAAGKNQISFDASTFSNGVYYVNIATENGSVTKKLIKK